MLALGARKGSNVTLADCMTLHAVLAFSWGPFSFRWALGCEDARDEISGRKRWLGCYEMVLDPRPCLTMNPVLLYKDHLAICFSFLCI